MKTIITVLLWSSIGLCSSYDDLEPTGAQIAASATAAGLFWIYSPQLDKQDEDKQLHFKISGMISSMTYLGLRATGQSRLTSYVSAVGITLAIGALKEATDEKFDWEDMKFDAMGATVVPLIFIMF